MARMLAETHVCLRVGVQRASTGAWPAIEPPYAAEADHITLCAGALACKLLRPAPHVRSGGPAPAAPHAATLMWAKSPIVPAELHVFPHGPHGVGLTPDDPVLSQRPMLCAAWLRAMGFLERRSP